MSTILDKVIAGTPAHLADDVRAFCKAAGSASYHHADDSGREWHLAKPHQAECQRIYDEGSDKLKARLRQIKGNYLITLKTEAA